MHVIKGVATHQFGIAAIGIINGGAFEVDPLRRGDPEVAGNVFQAVARQIAYHEIVAAHGIQRVDQLASGYAVAHAAAGFRADGQRFFPPLQAF